MLTFAPGTGKTPGTPDRAGLRGRGQSWDPRGKRARPQSGLIREWHLGLKWSVRRWARGVNALGEALLEKRLLGTMANRPPSSRGATEAPQGTYRGLLQAAVPGACSRYRCDTGREASVIGKRADWKHEPGVTREPAQRTSPENQSREPVQRTSPENHVGHPWRLCVYRCWLVLER